MDIIFLFFFFQAEDGIRDHCVTGVQTCALPIFSTGELVEQFLLQVYGGVDEATGVGEAGEAVPKEVLVPELPADADVYEELLSELRGSRVSLRVPQRGDKRALLETVERNAKEAFARHRVKRSSDLTARS